MFLRKISAALKNRRDPKLCIAGDHSPYHAGCRAVMGSLRSAASAKGWVPVSEGDRYDALLVNGEGSMHDGSKRFHQKMKLLANAVKAGKPAFLVNSVWQDNPPDYDSLLPQLSGIFVREVLSQRQLAERHGITAEVVPDASFFYLPDFVEEAHDYAGSPIVTDFFLEHRKVNGKKHIYGTLDSLFPGAQPIPFLTWDWSKIVSSMKTASYLITGRHHAVYAALCAGKPFIASEGNTHKIRGIIESAGADIIVAEKAADLPGIIEENLSKPAEYQKIINWARSHDVSSIIPSIDILR